MKEIQELELQWIADMLESDMSIEDIQRNIERRAEYEQAEIRTENPFRRKN